jgi:hypothetical protein
VKLIVIILASLLSSCRLVGNAPWIHGNQLVVSNASHLSCAISVNADPVTFTYGGGAKDNVLVPTGTASVRMPWNLTGNSVLVVVTFQAWRADGSYRGAATYQFYANYGQTNVRSVSISDDGIGDCGYVHCRWQGGDPPRSKAAAP